MATTTLKTPTMVVNGQSVLTTKDEWAKIKLSAEDYARYQSSSIREDAIWAEAETAGEITRTPLYETKSNGVRKLIGYSVTFHSGFGVAGDSEFYDFYQQFLNDPDLTWPA